MRTIPSKGRANQDKGGRSVRGRHGRGAPRGTDSAPGEGADAALRQKVAEQFPGCLDARGEVDRRALAAIVFGDKEKIAALNALTHPYIMQKLFAEMDACDAPAFAEVPLLFESGTAQLFDRVIVVMRDLPARIRAVCERDGIGEREALLRVQSQFDYENNSLNGHTVVYNNGTPEQLRSRVVQVVHEILC